MSEEKSLTSDQRRAHFRRLVTLAYADNQLDDHELAVLRGVARRWNITSTEVNDALDNKVTNPADWPENRETLASMFFDFVELSIIDGELKKAERQLLDSIAKSLGFAEEALDAVKNTILEGNRASKADEDIRAEACRLLS